MTAFEPLRHSTIREAARDALRHLIISGELSSDHPLRQDALASRLGISRTPLREALHALAGEGLVTIDPHRRAMVAKPSVCQLLQLYEIREELEVLAGRKVVAASTPAHVASLEPLYQEMTDLSDPVAWAEHNQRFHDRLYDVCDNRELVQMIRSLCAKAKFFVRILASTNPPTHRAQRDHRDMITALRAGDADAMEQAIRSHLRATVAVVAPTLSTTQPSGIEGQETPGEGGTR